MGTCTPSFAPGGEVGTALGEVIHFEYATCGTIWVLMGSVLQKFAGIHDTCLRSSAHNLNYSGLYWASLVGVHQFDGILPKGPYLQCLRMADRALLAEYPRIQAPSVRHRTASGLQLCHQLRTARMMVVEVMVSFGYGSWAVYGFPPKRGATSISFTAEGGSSFRLSLKRLLWVSWRVLAVSCSPITRIDPRQPCCWRSSSFDIEITDMVLQTLSEGISNSQ